MNFPHRLLTLFTLFLQLEIAKTELASTWDSCGCFWGVWTEWSDCSTTCGGGTRYRDRMVWHDDVPECDGFDFCASADMGSENNECNTFCENGGTYFESICSCLPGNFGRCCDETVNCGPPNTVSNGKVFGNESTYNSQIKYRCNDGYNMTNLSNALQICLLSGYWSGETPECLYTESCSSSPCLHNGTCMNELGYYNCVCEQGWEEKNCDIDVFAPVYDNCPDNIDIFTNNMSSFQSWPEPRFSDPHNFSVFVSKNYQQSEFEFPWGTFTIQYIAVKPSNGLKEECAFNITVKPHPCAELVLPENTILACNNWNTDYAVVCKYYCLDGYYYPVGITEHTVLSCGASGTWFPYLLFEGCVPYDSGNTENAEEMYGCSTADEKDLIAARYITDLRKSSFNKLCLDYEDLCNKTNVVVTC